MGFWSSYTGREVLNLESVKRENIAATQLTQDKKETATERVDKSKILEFFIEDALTFNTINLCTSITMAPGYTIMGDTSNEYETFFESMRLYGDNTSLRRLITALVSDRLAYGAGFLEYIYSSDGSKILDLRRVNPVKIDYARNNKRELIIDDSGRPIGYVMAFGYGYDTSNKGDMVPRSALEQGIKIPSGSIFINRERIAIFPLYKLPNDYDYIGIIEPAFKSIEWRRKIQKAQVNAINVKATSPYVMTVGSPTHEPNKQMMDNANNILAHIDESKALALPYTMVLGTVESKSLDIIEQTVNALMFDQAAASGTPLPLITGAGESTNRSTLKTQRELYESGLQARILDFVEDINHQIMVKLKEVNGYKANAQIVWGDVRLESREEKHGRLMTAIDRKVFSPQEVRNYLHEREQITLDEKAYKKFLKESTPKPNTNTNHIPEQQQKEDKEEKDSDNQEN